MIEKLSIKQGISSFKKKEDDSTSFNCSFQWQECSKYFTWLNEEIKWWRHWFLPVIQETTTTCVQLQAYALLDFKHTFNTFFWTWATYSVLCSFQPLLVAELQAQYSPHLEIQLDN